VGAINLYLATWREASQRCSEWRLRISALADHGFEEHPVYVYDGVYLRLYDGDLSDLKDRLEAAMAAANDPRVRAIMERKRDIALAEAQIEIDRWCQTACALGIPDAAEFNNLGWDAVDSLDVEKLWAAQPSSIEEVLGLLRLLNEVGWFGVHPEDCRQERQAVKNVIRFLDRS